jgi:hypothetical protein
VCSVLIVQSRALRVQGKGRFLALGVAVCFWGNETCICYVQGRMEKTTGLSGPLIYKGRQVSHKERRAPKGESACLGDRRRVYMVKYTRPDSPDSPNWIPKRAYISWMSHLGASK